MKNLNSNFVILPNEKNWFILYWIYFSLLTPLTSTILHMNKLREAKTSFHDSAAFFVPPALTRIHTHLICMFLRAKTKLLPHQILIVQPFFFSYHDVRKHAHTYLTSTFLRAKTYLEHNNIKVLLPPHCNDAAFFLSNLVRTKVHTYLIYMLLRAKT